MQCSMVGSRSVVIYVDHDVSRGALDEFRVDHSGYDSAVVEHASLLLLILVPKTGKTSQQLQNLFEANMQELHSQFNTIKEPLTWKEAKRYVQMNKGQKRRREQAIEEAKEGAEVVKGWKESLTDKFDTMRKRGALPHGFTIRSRGNSIHSAKAAGCFRT